MQSPLNESGVPKKIGDVLSSKKFTMTPKEPSSNQSEVVISKNEADTHFSTIYDGLTIRFKLSSVEVILLSKIVADWEYKSYSWRSQGTFARLAGTTTPTAIKYLRALMAKELIEKVPPNEIKPQHQNYTTVFLRLAPKAVDALTYLKKRIKQAAEDRKGRKYNKDAHSHLRSIS